MASPYATREPGESEAEYRRRYQLAYSKANRAKRRAIQAAYVSRHSEAVRRRTRDWNAAHPEVVKQAAKKHAALNPAKRYAAHRKWCAANPEKVKALERAKRARNPGAYLASFAQRRAAVRRATMPWSDKKKIEAIYAEAQRASVATGTSHVVDHYYPLQGDLVCGLHVHENLRVITRAENAWKSNRMPEEPPSVAGPFAG